MADLNMANRQCCDLDIREYETGKPFMFADFCNTTTAGFTGSSVYALKHGQRAIAFHDPIEGTMTCEFQVAPFKVYALMSDGTILDTATTAKIERIKCSTGGQLTVTGAKEGSVFVYADGEYGGTNIAGTYADDTFTATTADDIAAESYYEVGYLMDITSSEKTRVQRVAFNKNAIPKDFRVEMQTLDKDENGNLIPIKILAYKASAQRNLDLSMSDTGDPATVTITFDVLADKDDNVLDMIEIADIA